MHRILPLLEKASKRGIFSLLASIFIIASVISFSFKHEHWNKDKVVQHDVVSYYAYLPNMYIYNDLRMDYLFDGNLIEGESPTRVWFLENEHGNRFLKMPIGVSIMLTPFFLIAHGITLASDIPANGFNSTYFFFIALAAWTYAFLGLLLLRSVLRKLHIRDFAIALTFLGLALGTNFFFYTSIEVGMSHIYGFFLFTLILYLSQRWYEKQTALGALFIGLSIGLVTLVRPTNIMIALIPLLWGIRSIGDLKARMQFFKEHFKFVVIAGFSCGIILFLQPLVWKIGTGEWLLSFYPGEEMFPLKPHFWEGLFGYRKGTITYAPILLFAFIGFIFLFKKKQEQFWGITIFTIITLYLTFSWWCWWYGGSFGMRPLIESYALWSIPLALIIDHGLNKFTVIPVVGILVGAIFLNNYFIDNYVHGVLHVDSMSKKTYWALLQGKQTEPDYFDNMQAPSYYNASLGNSENELFKNDLIKRDTISFNGNEYGDVLFEVKATDYFKYKQQSALDINAELYIDEENFNPDDFYFVISIHNFESGVDHQYHSIELKPEQYTSKAWHSFTHQQILDKVKDEKADIRVYFWNKGRKKVKLKKIEINQLVY